MATQDDIYRESQRTAAEAVKTTEELQKIVIGWPQGLGSQYCLYLLFGI